ncbi:MAG: hypothetical protein KAJ19_28105, partial [Gammaproteobacteria bacterium]|nr:hypothetical protein [Gammaproteobacteria bacterium]
MLDSDYAAMQYDDVGVTDKPSIQNDLSVSSQIIKEIIIPEIEREVNEGTHFAPLRQIYHSLILAKWYKETIKNSLLSQVYADKNLTDGVQSDDVNIKDKIYDQYMEAYKKGVFNYIREDYDRLSQEVIPRKYFSGGINRLTNFNMIRLSRTHNPGAVQDVEGDGYRASVAVTPQNGGASSPVTGKKYRSSDKNGLILDLESESLIKMVERMIAQQVEVNLANPFVGPGSDVTYHEHPKLGGYVIQENPGRAPEKREAKSEATKDAGHGNPGIPICFICYGNVPANEMIIPYGNNFLIYPNPAPFEKNHIVIAEKESDVDRHPVQLLTSRDQVEVAVDVIGEIAVKNDRPAYNISFNSFGAANSSSHFHFQGFETGRLMVLGKPAYTIAKNGVHVGFVADYAAEAILVEGSDRDKVIDEVLRIAKNLNETFKSHNDLLFNIEDENVFRKNIVGMLGNPGENKGAIPYSILFKAESRGGKAYFRVFFYPRAWETPKGFNPDDPELLDTKFGIAEL